MSHNCCIVCADSKTCLTFYFTLINRPRLAEIWKYWQILVNIGKYWKILLIFVNITVQLCHIIVGIVCADSKACQTFDFTLRNRPRLAEMWKYLQILANLGKYWQILANIDVQFISYTVRTWYSHSKTYQTFNFTLRKTHFIAKKLKGHFFWDTLYVR